MLDDVGLQGSPLGVRGSHPRLEGLGAAPRIVEFLLRQGGRLHRGLQSVCATPLGRGDPERGQQQHRLLADVVRLRAELCLSVCALRSRRPGRGLRVAELQLPVQQVDLGLVQHGVRVLPSEGGRSLQRFLRTRLRIPLLS